MPILSVRTGEFLYHRKDTLRTPPVHYKKVMLSPTVQVTPVLINPSGIASTHVSRGSLLVSSPKRPRMQETRSSFRQIRRGSQDQTLHVRWYQTFWKKGRPPCLSRPFPLLPSFHTPPRHFMCLPLVGLKKENTKPLPPAVLISRIVKIITCV